VLGNVSWDPDLLDKRLAEVESSLKENHKVAEGLIATHLDAVAGLIANEQQTFPLPGVEEKEAQG
jgi:hypothetical protein